MEFFSKAFDWFAELSTKLPNIEFKTFFIAVLAIIGGTALIVALTLLGSNCRKIYNASLRIIKYLADKDSIDDDNVGEFTTQCFSSKAPQSMRDAWVQFLGIRFGYPSEIVSEQSVFDKEVKRHRDIRANVFICIALVLVAAFAFWGYGTLESHEMGVIHCLGLLLSAILYFVIVALERKQRKRALEMFNNMQEDLDAKVNLQVERNFAVDSSPINQIASVLDEIIARNTSKYLDEDAPLPEAADEEENAPAEEETPESEETEPQEEERPEEESEQPEEEPQATEEEQPEQEPEEQPEEETEEQTEEENQTPEEEPAPEESEVSEEEQPEEEAEEELEEFEAEAIEEEAPQEEEQPEEESEQPEEEPQAAEEEQEEQSEESETEEISEEEYEEEEAPEEGEEQPEEKQPSDETLEEEEQPEEETSEEEPQEEQSEEETSEEEAPQEEAEEEPEVIYQVEGDEDEEEEAPPAKLAKLPNLIDYMLSMNLSRSMKINFAMTLLGKYNKFKDDPEEKKILVTCVKKIIADLQKA